MRVRNHGKYTNMRRFSPRAIGRCDYSGLMVEHSRLKPQYQYRGQGLVRTGYLVYDKFLDKPNPQDLTPLIKMDPVPIVNPRIDYQIGVIPDVTYQATITGNVILSTDDYTQNTTFIFDGELTAPSTVFIPNLFQGFYITNNTTGGFPLSLQLTNNSFSNINLIPNTQMLVNNDGYTLHILYQ